VRDLLLWQDVYVSEQGRGGSVITGAAADIVTPVGNKALRSGTPIVFLTGLRILRPEGRFFKRNSVPELVKLARLRKMQKNIIIHTKFSFGFASETKEFCSKN
jgi:hypothetical protein